MNEGGIDYTPEYIAARKNYLLRNVLEQQRLERLKGHTFTRRTYRVAVRRSIDSLVEAAWNGRFAEQCVLFLAIRARGRREKGMWS